MTTRSLHRGLAGLALLLQVLAGANADHALVLCVGPAGHVAVEDSEDALRCRGDSDQHAAAPSSDSATLGAQAACVDTPLARVTVDRGMSASRFDVAAIAPAPALELSRPAVIPTHANSRNEAPLAHARILRSVVLLI